MDEKTLEYINDIRSSSGVVSDCCGAYVYDGLCGDCHDHCTAVYEEIECPNCGNSIDAETNCCLGCGRYCSDIL